MTAPEFLVLLLVACLMLMFPKPVSKKKSRKPIRARPRLRRSAVYLRDRPLRQDTIDFAEKCRAQNLKQARKNSYIKQLCLVLKELGEPHDLEIITYFDGNRFVLSDVVLLDKPKVVELNGRHHRYEHIRDWEKAKMIKEIRGWDTISFWNTEVFKHDFKDRLNKFINK